MGPAIVLAGTRGAEFVATCFGTNTRGQLTGGDAAAEAALLDLELTETVFLDEPKQAIANIEFLRDTGISISIDDFGTGYSSLSYLKALPINRLKIDRSFVKDIPDHDDGMIAETVISLAHNLGMSVLAEGIDSEQQLNFLEHRKCDEYQGYLFSRPLPGPEASELLRSTKTSNSYQDTVAAL